MRLKVRLLHKNRGQPDNFSYVIVEAENGNDAAVIALESINHPDNPLGIRYERTLVSHIEPAPNPEAKPINKVKPTMDGLVEEQAELIKLQEERIKELEEQLLVDKKPANQDAIDKLVAKLEKVGKQKNRLLKKSDRLSNKVDKLIYKLKSYEEQVDVT